MIQFATFSSNIKALSLAIPDRKDKRDWLHGIGLFFKQDKVQLMATSGRVVAALSLPLFIDEGTLHPSLFLSVEQVNAILSSGKKTLRFTVTGTSVSIDGLPYNFDSIHEPRFAFDTVIDQLKAIKSDNKGKPVVFDPALSGIVAKAAKLMQPKNALLYVDGVTYSAGHDWITACLPMNADGCEILDFPF